MTTPDWYANYGGDQPAHDTFEDDGVTPNVVTTILTSHTGTLMTDGHGNGDTDRTGTLYGVTVDLGADTSAAAINPFLSPDLDPLPEGYVAGPTLDGPIY